MHIVALYDVLQYITLDELDECHTLPDPFPGIWCNLNAAMPGDPWMESLNVCAAVTPEGPVKLGAPHRPSPTERTTAEKWTGGGWQGEESKSTLWLTFT